MTESRPVEIQDRKRLRDAFFKADLSPRAEVQPADDLIIRRQKTPGPDGKLWARCVENRRRPCPPRLFTPPFFKLSDQSTQLQPKNTTYSNGCGMWKSAGPQA